MLEGFSDWMEGQEKSPGSGFGDWMTKEFNVEDKDFADIGNIHLVNRKLKPDGSDEPIEYKRPTLFKLSRNKDGTVYRLEDLGQPDPSDPRKSAFPHAAASPYYGKRFTLTKDEYEELLKFPPRQAGPGI